MSQQRRAITKSQSMSIKSVSFGGDSTSERSTMTEFFSYQCSIWSSSSSIASNLSTVNSLASSLLNSLSNSSINSASTSSTGFINCPRRQLPSVTNNFNVELTNPKNGMKCTFCKNNGECEDIWRSHVLKDLFGNICCPLLMAYKCPICVKVARKRTQLPIARYSRQIRI